MLFGRKSRAVESAAKDEDLAWRLEAIGQNVATIRFTPDGQILSANPLFLAVVGYSADELVGKHHRIFCEEDFQASAAYVRFWKELASGTPQRGVFKRLRRDGSPVWLEATYFPVKNAEGAVVEVLKIAADVTRNHSELLLLNAINDAIRQSMAVIEFTPDGEILDANENFLRLFGYSLKSLKGQHHRMLCFDEFYRENPDFWARLRHGEFSRGHFERRSAAGERVHIEATYNPVKDSSGRIIKVIKFAIDVTEQVNRNEEVRRAAELSFSTAEETAQISTRGIDSLDQSVALSAKTLSMVNTAVGLISQLTHQTKDIENIVTTIQSVAEQTNLLAMLIERADGSVQILDGTAKTSLARVEGLGDLSHASLVFSRDQRYAYVFGRDGGLTKLDLLAQRIDKRLIQGGNSIGGAISQDGRLVAVSNYEPGGVKVFDSRTLELVAEIPATRLPGQDRNSRVVGLVDAPGQRFVFSLFDSGEIWIADFSQGDTPHLTRFRDIGKQPYDALISPDGRYYMAGLFGEDGMAQLDLWHPERGVRRVLGDYGRGQRKLPVYKMPHLEGWTIASDQAFVPAVGHHQVLVLDARDWKQTDAIDVAGQPVFVMTRPDDRQIWVNFAYPDNDKVQVIDSETHEVIETLRPGPGVLHMEFSGRGDQVWISVRDADQLQVWDPYRLINV